MFSLSDLSLCSFADYVSGDTNFHITKNQTTRDVISIGISDQIKEKVGLYLKEGVTLLMELTRRSSKFNASREMTRRTSLRGILIETFRDFTEHRGKYRFDGSIKLRDFYVPDHYDEDPDCLKCCLLSSKSSTYFCNRLVSPSQMVNFDPDSSIEIAHF